MVSETHGHPMLSAPDTSHLVLIDSRADGHDEKKCGRAGHYGLVRRSSSGRFVKACLYPYTPIAIFFAASHGRARRNSGSPHLVKIALIRRIAKRAYRRLGAIT